MNYFSIDQINKLEEYFNSNFKKYFSLKIYFEKEEDKSTSNKISITFNYSGHKFSIYMEIFNNQYIISTNQIDFNDEYSEGNDYFYIINTRQFDKFMSLSHNTFNEYIEDINIKEIKSLILMTSKLENF